MEWRRNVAENFNRLSRAHERYRQTDRQTDGLGTSLKLRRQTCQSMLRFLLQKFYKLPAVIIHRKQNFIGMNENQYFFKLTL